MAELHVVVLPSIKVAGKDYRVLEFEMDERLSELGGLSVAIYSDEEVFPPPGDLLDQPASFKLERSDGSATRSFEGVVVAAELAPDEDDVPAMHLVVMPAL